MCIQYKGEERYKYIFMGVAYETEPHGFKFVPVGDGEIQTLNDATEPSTCAEHIMPFPNNDYEIVGTVRMLFQNRFYKSLRRMVYGWNRKQPLRLKQIQRAGKWNNIHK